MDFQRVVWFNFGTGEKVIDDELVLINHPMEVWVRYSYDVKEQPRSVCYFKKHNQTALDLFPPPLYSQYPKPIKKAKADLQKLVKEYVPEEYQSFYNEMPETDDSDSDD